MKFGIQKSGLSKSNPGAKSRPTPPGPTYSQSARSGFATLELAAVLMMVLPPEYWAKVASTT
jgi:hypothetical protein